MKYRIIAAGTLLALVAGFVLWSSQTTKATINDTPANRSVTRQQAFEKYDGKYFSFTHRGTYQASASPAQDDDLEIAMLDAGTNYEKHLAVVVSKLPAGNLNNNSAYLLRKSQPNTYTLKPVTVAGAPAEIWVRNDGLEQTVFVQHGGVIAILSFTTVGTIDDLTSETAALLKTFTWKQ